MMNCDTVRWLPNLYWIPLSWLHTETLLHVRPFTLERRAVHVNVCLLPPHLHSCSVPLTRTLRWAEALPFPLWCQNKYHFFIWSCAASWEVALTPAWASPSSAPPPPKKASYPTMGTRILTSPVRSKLGHHDEKPLCLEPLRVWVFVLIYRDAGSFYK